MKTLFMACGNPLRRDDGAAVRVLQLLAPKPDREFREVQQLTPECAEEIAGFARVIFLDADVTATHTRIEPVSVAKSRSQLTHASTPGEIVPLARALFNFGGEAFVCRIPVRDFSPGESLTAEGLRSAQEAVSQLESFS
jgi:hydrogenase maturation protease